MTVFSLLKPFLPLLLLLLVLSALSAWLKSIKGKLGERAVHRAIKASGAVAITDFIIPDGRGGLTQVDHVIKLPVGIGVIETKNYSGKIYGKAGEPTWTQTIGNLCNKFQNPIRQNYLHVEAIRLIVGPEVDLLGHVIFVGDAKFKEMPDGVSDLSDLKKHLRAVRGIPIPSEVEAAWDKLVAAMRDDREARIEHLAGLMAKKAR